MRKFVNVIIFFKVTDIYFILYFYYKLGLIRKTRSFSIQKCNNVTFVKLICTLMCKNKTTRGIIIFQK